MVVGVVVVPIWSSSLAVTPNMRVSERTREKREIEFQVSLWEARVQDLEVETGECCYLITI